MALIDSFLITNPGTTTVKYDIYKKSKREHKNVSELMIKLKTLITS